MAQIPRNPVNITLGIENSTSTPQEHSTVAYPFKPDKMDLSTDPILNPVLMQPFFEENELILQGDPYKGSRPSFPAVRRFILNHALARLDRKLPKVREDALLTYHHTDAMGRAVSSSASTRSQITGEQLDVLGRRSSRISGGVVKRHNKWMSANIKTISTRGELKDRHARTEQTKRDKFTSPPISAARRYKRLSDRRLRKIAKINRINERT